MQLKSILILSLLFWISTLDAQTLHLNIISDSETESFVIDSMAYRKKHPNIESITKEVDSIEKRLEKMGYIQLQSLGLTKLNDSIYHAKIILNKKYKFLRVYYKDIVPRNLISNYSLNFNKEYLDIEVSMLEKFMQQLNKTKANQGMPFSSVKLQNIQINEDSILLAELSFKESKKRTIDKIIIKGYNDFPRSFLKRNLKIKEGHIFSLATIERKMKKLENLQFAKELKSPEVLFTNDSTHLYIYVEKLKQNSFDGFLGFGTNENTNKLEFDGYLNLALTNNLNFGESFQLYYKSDENNQKTFDTNITMPYILGSAIGVEVNLNIFKRDSSFLNVDQIAKLNYQFSSVFKSGIGINASSSSKLIDNPLSNIKDYNSIFGFIDTDFSLPNNTNTLFPVNSQLYAATKVGKRTYDDQEDQQLKFSLDGFNIFNLNVKNSIYIRLTAEHLESNFFLENELSRFGGINSIRGFEENSLLANTFGVLNTEYRYELSPSLYIHSVIDAAYFENRLSDQKSKLFGFGFGFGLLTNAGLLKLTYANGKTQDQKTNFNDSKIHLSLSATF